MKKNTNYPYLKLHKIWKQLGNRLLIEYDMTFDNNHIYQIRVNSEPNIDINNIKQFVTDWNNGKYRNKWKEKRQELIKHEIQMAKAEIQKLKNEIKEMK